MATHKLFKSILPSCFYVFSTGKYAYFVGGRYHTANVKEIEELNREIQDGHPHMYVDAVESEIDTELLDPMAQIKKKIIDEYLANTAKAMNPDNDRGTYAQDSKLGGITDTNKINAGSADSSSGQVVPDLSALKVRVAASANTGAPVSAEVAI